MSAPVYIRRSREVAARRIGDELMIMSGRTSALFSLNETAALLWQAADGVTPLQEIVETQIRTQFDIDADSALADARTVLDELASHGILDVSAEPMPPETDLQS